MGTSQLETSQKVGLVGAGVVLLLAAATFAAWQLRPSVEVGQDQAVAVAVDVTSSPASSSPSEAIAMSVDEGDGQHDWRIQRNIVIHADSRQVDLRVQAVTSDDDCRWFAVSGEVQDEQLAWRAGRVPADVGTC